MPAGAEWPAVLASALAGAVSDLRAALGDDMDAWRWERLHTTRPVHPLVAGFPKLAATLNPPAVAVGGDGETVNAAGFVPGAGYHVALTSVARYVFDLADWESERLGRAPRRLRPSRQPALGRSAPGLGPIAGLLPMRYDWSRIAKEAEVGADAHAGVSGPASRLRVLPTTSG